MKTIGILGGLGPEATVDYYKEIIKGFRKINGEESLHAPEILIYSVNMAKFIGLLEKGQLTEGADYLSKCLQKLKNGGADFAAISANTPHLLFDEICSEVDLPLISIVEACAKRAKQQGVKNCALIGTKFTMQNQFYQEVFRKFNIQVTVPTENRIEQINTRLFKELELGIFKEDTKKEILGFIQELIAQKGIDSVILGCTEFPLMFQDSAYLGVPFFNTTQIHVDEIIKKCLDVN